MTFQQTALKAMVTCIADKAVQFNMKKQQQNPAKNLIHKKANNIIENNQPINFHARLIIFPILQTQITSCEKRTSSIQKPTINQTENNKICVLGNFSSIQVNNKTDELIEIFKDQYTKNPNLNNITINIENNFFNIKFDNNNPLEKLKLGKKIYDISSNELKINDLEGICYRNKINGKYVRLSHLKDCPDISILQTGNNRYVIFPSKHYLEKKQRNNNNISFKDIIHTNMDFSNQLFSVLTKFVKNGQSIKITEPEKSEINSIFRVSIE